MKVSTIYLETTIFNFSFSDDASRADTSRLFEEIQAGTFQPFTSEYATRELEDTPDGEKKEKMRALISKYGVTVIPASDEVKRLADMYLSIGIIPEKYSLDALHIAVAAVAGIDSIVSLNFRHIVKHLTIIETGIINVREGYKRVSIYTPAEVIDLDDNHENP